MSRRALSDVAAFAPFVIASTHSHTRAPYCSKVENALVSTPPGNDSMSTQGHTHASRWSSSSSLVFSDRARQSRSRRLLSLCGITRLTRFLRAKRGVTHDFSQGARSNYASQRVDVRLGAFSRRRFRSAGVRRSGFHRRLVRLAASIAEESKSAVGRRPRHTALAVRPRRRGVLSRQLLLLSANSAVSLIASRDKINARVRQYFQRAVERRP